MKDVYKRQTDSKSEKLCHCSIFRHYSICLLYTSTFHANVFATIHRDATNYLFDKMEEKGMYGYVGKVKDVYKRQALKDFRQINRVLN